MVQKKKSDEQDVLVVRDEKTGEISVVAGLSRDGTPKRAPAKAENTSDFLRFDRNSDLMDSFFRNFFRQCKEPSRFGFYRIAADQVENLLGVMKELLKDPEANKEILSAHKVDTSNYEKEAKQSEGQAKETASSDDASKTQANTEKENVSSEQTNEKENDMEQKPEQTATEQQAQTAPGVKQNLISGNDVNLQELGAKYGIDFNSMNEKDMKALLNYGKTGLVIVKPTFGGEQIEIQARLSFRKDDNDQLQLVPHFVRNEPKLDVAYKGYTFTPEDKKNLLQNGNLGKVVDFPDKNTGELRPHFISIDRLTNEIVDIPTNKVRIPDTIGKTPITKDDKRVLYSGIPLRKEIELANGRKFTPLLQVNVEQRGVEFVPGSTRQVQGQKQNGDKKQTADKQEQKAEGDVGGQKKQQDPNHWLNEDGTIRRLNTYFKKELTEQQKDDYVAGKTIEIKEVPNKNGSGTYTAYVKFDFDKMQPRSYRNNPDIKQAKEQIPTNENKVQVAVNEQGKTHEATKHTKEPLSPGQSAPKNEKQQKEQNAEEQKPKRKARSVNIGQEVGGGEGLQHPSALMGRLSDHEDAIDHVDAIESQHRIEPAADMPTAPQIVAKGEAANDGSIESRAGQGHVAPFGLDGFEIVDSHGYQSETGSIDEHVDHGSQVVVGGPDVKSHLDIVLGGKKHQGKEDHQAGALVAFVLPAGVQAGQGDKERIDQHEDEGGKLK